MHEDPVSESIITETERLAWCSEDVWAIWLGAIVLVVALAATWWARPADHQERLRKVRAVDPVADRIESLQRRQTGILRSIASTEETCARSRTTLVRNWRSIR